MSNCRANDLLGYPADARLLIVNADDFGMSHAINAAILRTLTHGVVQSMTLIFATLVILVNLITDLTYSFLDPRVRLG